MSTSDDVLVGRYRLLQQIGAGGMGVVWRAYDERLGRDVAVKRLHPAVSPDDPDAQVLSHRAMREARITARLHHPHAVPVFDVVEHHGQPCLVMQYFPSSSLAELLTAGPALPVPQVARIGAEVASALAAAHDAGIVHRDVKPANVLVAPDGTAKISDFGISHAMGDVSLTSSGLVTGTPAYLAPEVARGEPATPASDVFSLASTLYTVLEGHTPFGTHENPMALLHRVASGEVEPPRRSGVLTALLTSMLAARPQDRPDMADVARQLGRVGAHADAGDVDVTVPAGIPLVAGADVLDGHGAGETPVAVDGPGVLEGDGAVDTLGAADGSGTRSSAEDPLWPFRDDEQPAATAEPIEGSRPPRRRLLLPLLAVVAAIAAVAIGVALWPQDAPTAAPTTSAATTRPSSSPSSPTPTTATPSPSASSSAPASTTRPPAATTRPPAPTTSAPRPTPSPTPTPKASTPPAAAAGSPSARELRAAVQDYYALLPDDLEAGWARLTPRYQRTTARNRATYESFWGAIDRVSVSDVTASAPGSVTATVTYEYADGRDFVERTSYKLLRQDGRLKIDRSSVLSSRQR
jgi:eukaryotic-like serine/threonine-protein kinase